MKKFIPLALIILLLFGILDYKYTRSKHRDVNYVVERHLTSGIFNSNRLKTIELLQVAYSDGRLAIVTVSGLEKETPNKKVKYQVLAERNSNGDWEVKKVYTTP